MLISTFVISQSALAGKQAAAKKKTADAVIFFMYTCFVVSGTNYTTTNLKERLSYIYPSAGTPARKPALVES